MTKRYEELRVMREFSYEDYEKLVSMCDRLANDLKCTTKNCVIINEYYPHLPITISHAKATLAAYNEFKENKR